MKTKEEIVKHLFEKSYDNEEVKKIFKYLEEKGLAEKFEDPKFEDFKKWFEGEEQFDWDGIDIGDYVKLKDGVLCIVLDFFEDEKVIVANNGCSSFAVDAASIERGCTDEEVEYVDKILKEKCNLYYNDDYCGLLPIGIEYVNEE